MQSLGTLGGPDSYGKDINAKGDIVGTSYPPGGGVFPCNHFLWRASFGPMIDLGVTMVCDPDGLHAAISDSGRIAGIDGPMEKAFTMLDVAAATILPTGIHPKSGALDVNTCGTIAGYLSAQRRVINGTQVCDP
jgi:uncharacterized membrane protein